MKKITRKISAMLAAALLTLNLAACSSETQSDSTTQDDSQDKNGSVTIAYHGYDSGSTDNIIFGNSVRKMCELAGVEFVAIPDMTYDADSCISFVETQIASGVNGLLFSPPSDSVLPTVTKLCEDAGVYWGISTRSIEDETIRETVEASSYYVGNCYEDEYTVGETMMNYMNDFGYKKLAMISTAKGNSAVDAREKAVVAACEEYGMEVVVEARDFTQPSEITAACQSFLSAYDDLDAIFIVGTYAQGATSAAVKAVQDAGRADNVKVTAVDFGLTPALVESFNSGVLTLDVIGLQYDPFCVATKVINAVTGNPISESGFQTELGMDYITDPETAAKWEETYSNTETTYITEDQMKQILAQYNEGLNADSFNELVNSWGLVK